MTRTTLDTGSNGVQLQLEYGSIVDAATGGAITADTTGVKFSNLEAWLDTNGYHTVDSSNNLAVSGGWCTDDSSNSNSIDTSGSVKLKELGCTTVAPIFGGSEGTHEVRLRSTGIGTAGTMEGAKSWATPRRPYHLPYSPIISIDADYVYISGNQNDPAADRYWQKLDIYLETNDAPKVAVLLDYPGTATALNLFSLRGTNCRYRVAVYSENSEGTSPASWSNYWYGPPSAPTAVAAARQAVKTSVLVTWGNGAPYAASFAIERALDAAGWVQIGTSTTGSFTDTNLPMGSHASYRVRTLSMAGANSIYSGYTQSANVPEGYIIPAVPASAVFTRTTDAAATLTLSGNQNSAASDQYWASVEWCMQTDAAAFPAAQSLMGTTTAFTILGQVANKRYQMAIRSVNVAGASAWKYSNYIYTTPAAPTGLTATRAGAASSTVNLAWVNNAAWLGQTIVERSTNGGSSWVQLGTSAGTSYVDTLPVVTSALYRVTAQTPAPYLSSAASATALVPVALISDKARFPGVDRIYVGTDRVRKMALGSQNIWTDGDE